MSSPRRTRLPAWATLEKVFLIPELIVEQNRSVVCKVDFFGRIERVWVNSEFTGPLSPENMKGLHFRDLVIEEDLPKVLQLMEGRRDLTIDFTLTIPTKTRRRCASLLDLKRDHLLVQIRKCPAYG